jgi:hypothetical protein
MKHKKKDMYTSISGKALVISKAKNNVNKISRDISTKRRGYDSSVSDNDGNSVGIT